MASLDLSALDWLCFALVIVGALNWGIIGIADVNVVEQLLEPVFQSDPAEIIARTVYVLVGLAGLFILFPLSKMARASHNE